MQRSLRRFSISPGSIALGAAALSLGFSAFALASDPASATHTEQVRLEVSYSDLNLARTDHAGELYTRIERAAREVCHLDYGLYARALPAQRTCEAKAVRDAVQSVSNENLSAVYAAKIGKRSMVASSR
ncbi:MAG: UrcA family protein [Gammaproteobacteria bacterium]